MLDGLPLVAAACFVLLQLTAALYDFWRLRIPNPLPVGLAFLFLLAAAAQPASVAWLHHLAAGAIVFAVGAVMFRFNVLGGGDVKLLAATALWIGLAQLPLYLLCMALIGLALAIALLVARRFVPPVLGWLPASAAPAVPEALAPGAGVPYGVAIAGGAVLLAFGVIG